MTEQHDRDELVERISRYANMPDTQNWDELPRSVFCDEITCDFSALGAPVTTISRDAWCQRTKQAFAGWTATHHAISNLRIAIDGDRATIQAHIRAEHCAPPEVAVGGPNCWLVVGFYDDVAARTPQGWRLSSVTLTLSHEENEALLAATPDPVEPDDEGEAPPLLGLAAPVTRAVLGWVLLGQALSPLQLAGFAVTVEAIANGAILPAAVVTRRRAGGGWGRGRSSGRTSRR